MKLKNLIDIIFDHWPAKIICFTLALLLFLFYRMSTLENRFFSAPLHIESNGDIVPASAYPQMVKITLRGEIDAIYPVIENDIIPFVDLTAYTSEGEYRIPVQTRLKGTALNANPLEVSVEPSELVLRLEHRVEKKVPVVAIFKGYPEAGYEFAGYTVTPSIMDLSGPRSAIEKITEIETEAIDLFGRNAGFSGSINLVNPEALVTLGGDGRVDYRVNIEQTILIKEFTNVPFYYENLRPEFTAEANIPYGMIRLKGAEKRLSRWELPENALTVLCETITVPGEYVLPVHPIIPGTFEVLDSTPSEIILTITRKDE
ncbi:hypothetical protein K7I13_14840 [Brucepastera parasyntrophica]|uniref:CdaR family protein n=1 Tax=Brucepastera parasyntrophica TaxID=2880008 RepID=UPI00210A5A00|nr:YbbR-like domain-containing protein [Brucepastera parasyntrophica]ULQ59711.1 hypothetical protein K7I13_14840 [Brucepastera parasyntrophica]